MNFFLSIPLILVIFSCSKENETQKSNINYTSIGTSVGIFQNSLTDIDYNVYKTVKIGTQTWMVENLKTTKYNDGTIISKITDKNKWSNIDSGAWTYYNDNVSNNDKYGKLYNWFAIKNNTVGNKNICPVGWHVPNEIEWSILIEHLGGESVTGGKMKEVGFTSWQNPNSEATNSSLFTGLPGGIRNSNGYFDDIGSNGYWWSSNQANTKNAWFRKLYSYDDAIGRDDLNKNCGLSIRCIKD